MIHRRHLLVAALLCTGCAEPEVELAFAAGRVELGAALRGSVTQQRVKLKNLGSTLLHLGGTTSTSPDFSLVMPLQSALPANELTTLNVHHVPPLGATGPQTARLSVWTHEGSVASVEVESVPVAPECELPEVLEFGLVQPGESVTLELLLRNSTELETEAEVGEFFGPPGAFAVQQLRHAIPANGELSIPVTFRPHLEAHFAGKLTVRRHHLCRPAQIALFGVGVTNAVRVEPSPLVWLTPLGNTETQLVILRNRAPVPITLFDVQTREGANASEVFRATRFPVRIPAAQRVGHESLIAAETTVEVSFTPVAAETRLGELVLSTDFPSQPLLRVELVGVAP